jgi:hypothetical protein
LNERKEVIVDMKKVLVWTLCLLLAFAFSLTLGCQKASEKASEVKEKAVKEAGEIKDKAVKGATEVKDKAAETATKVKDKVIETATSVKEKAVGKTGEPTKK